ncbi:MAG: YigZ family protein [Clostridia bacterium]|nr:YigZ family protein [Clostridia bacterium]
MFKTIKESVSGEIVEKKSKFIANIFYVESVEEAENKIAEISKKYFDSKHNCYAFSIYTENGIVNRFSDNGEPSGTAGGPMLNIINSLGLSNILVIVTRYFGGILLGTGGLVRAYSEATNIALEKAEIIEMDLGISAYVEVSYSDLNKIKYYFEQNGIEMVHQEFNENIKIFINLQENKFDEIVGNKENFNFKILSFGKIKKKYIKNMDNL